MIQNKNMTHASMLSEYVDSPVHYILERDVMESLTVKGRGMTYHDFPWVFPHRQMSIGLNRHITVGNCTVLLKDVYFGILPTSVPAVSPINKLIIEDFAKKIVWAQDNCVNAIHMLDSLSGRFSHIVEDVMGDLIDMPALERRYDTLDAAGLMTDAMMSDEYVVRSMLKHCGNSIINEAIVETATSTENCQAFVFFVTFIGPDGEGNLYDWVNTGSLFDTIHSVNRRYFDDGFNNVIYDAILALLFGLSAAWSEKTVIESKPKITKAMRKKRKKAKGGGIRLRTLKYDADATVFQTNTAPSASSGEPTGQWTQQPHNRSETHAFVWVSPESVKDDEIIYDTGTHPTSGNQRVKVKRKRRGYSVHGGAKKVIHGRIKSV